MTKLGFNVHSLARLTKSADVFSQKNNHQSNPFGVSFKGQLKADTFQSSNQSIGNQSFLANARSYTDNVISNLKAKYSQSVSFAGKMKNKIGDSVMSVMPQSMRVQHLAQKSVSELGDMLSIVLNANG